MFEILLLSLAAILIPCFFGYFIVNILRFKKLHYRLALSYPLGIGALIIMISAFNIFSPIKAFFLPLAIAIIAIEMLSLIIFRKKLVKDFKKFIKIKGKFAIPATIIIVLSVFLLPLFQLGYPTTMEGLDNHDSIYYTNTSRWLNSHNSTEALDYTITFPINNLSEYCLGKNATTPRIGTEQWLAFFADLTDLETYQAYYILLVSFMIGWISALTLLLNKILKKSARKFNPLLKLILICFTPLAFHFVINSNFSNFLGIALMCTFLSLTLSRKKGLFNRFNIAAALSLAGLVAVYSDMLSVALGVAALEIIFSNLKPLSFKRLFQDILRFAWQITLSMIFGFWFWYTYLMALPNFLNTTLNSQLMYLLGLFRQLDPAQTVIAAFTSSHAFASTLPLYLSIPFAAILGFVFVYGIIKTRKSPIIWAAIIMFILMLSTVILKNFTYGQNKLIQYFSPFIAIIFALGIFNLAQNPNKENDEITWKEIVIGLFMSAYIIQFVFIYQGAMLIFPHKTITKDFSDLVVAQKLIPKNDEMMIVEETLPNFYFTSMWANYFMDSTPLYFTKSGGYLDQYVLPEYQKNQKQIMAKKIKTFLIGTSAKAQFDQFLNEETSVLFQNQIFSIVQSKEAFLPKEQSPEKTD